MRDVHALIFGHSHANALAQAAKTYVPAHPGFSVRVAVAGSRAFPGGLVLRTADGLPMINPLIASAVQRSLSRPGRETWIVSALGVNYHNKIALIASTEPFDFVLPGREDLPVDPAARLLPYDVVADAMRASMNMLPAALPLLTQMGAAGVIQLEGPGPVRDSALVAQYLSAYRPPRLPGRDHGPDVAPSEMVVSPPALRLKAWLLHQMLVQELCAAHGVGYLGVPAEMMEADGFRRPDTVADAIHANQPYARAVLRLVEDRLMAAPALAA